MSAYRAIENFQLPFGITLPAGEEIEVDDQDMPEWRDALMRGWISGQLDRVPGVTFGA